MIHNHWGILCDTEQPVTTVYSGNELNWEFLPEMIDPTDYTEVPEEDRECYEPTTWLIGDWLWCKPDKVWDIDRKHGKHGFAMLYDSNDNIAQLFWSRTTSRGAMCSPCYPGQVDSTTVGESDLQLCYVLPDEYIFKPVNVARKVHEAYL